MKKFKHHDFRKGDMVVLRSVGIKRDYYLILDLCEEARGYQVYSSRHDFIIKMWMNGKDYKKVS